MATNKTDTVVQITGPDEMKLTIHVADAQIKRILQKAEATPRRLSIVDWAVRDIAEHMTGKLVWSVRATQAVMSTMRGLVDEQLRTQIERVAETLGLLQIQDAGGQPA